MSEDVKNKDEIKQSEFFGFGPDREPIHGSKLVNTSGLHLPKSKKVTIDGKEVDTGYLSHSAMEDYRRCQKHFEFRYVLRKKGKVSMAMIEGGAVHGALESMLRPKLGGGEKLASLELACDTFRDILEDRLSQAGPELLQDDDISDKGRIIDLNVKLVRQFYKDVAPRISPVAIEKMFIKHIPISGTEGTVPVVGFIDLIDMKWNVGQMVIDFKTGRTLKSANDITTDSQLTLYAYAEDIPNVGFISLKKGTADKPGGVSAKTGKPLKDKAGSPPQIVRVEGRKCLKDYEILAEDISNAAKGISAGYFDRTGRGSWLCSTKYCPYFNECLG